MEKFICIHGHFYQPPRENPWLEAIEIQDSAAPWHDWNERITVECYAPNAAARILNGEGKIERIVSNYSKISFNFGPTLLAWMQEKAPKIHEAIIAADKLSRENFSGHGSALAQVYNHMILPLANARDKYTQVLWGIRDFEHRFGRAPEGMWLSETAADTETLDTLAQLGIKFTILSPYQASRTREIGKSSWRDVSGNRIDPTRAYLVKLPSRRSINVFFYDAPVSQGIAFEKLLSSGEKFADRLAGAFNDKREWDQLVNIATDGESYGHHHRHGEMALAFALRVIEGRGVARLTNYAEFLEKFTPKREVKIHEKSAWSCSHGVGRWMTDCGCNSGGHSGWNQAWRAPLRESLDWLRDTVAPLFENKAKEFLRDPWSARNDYISVILDRSSENREKFFREHATHELNDGEKVAVLKLMELQRHAMLMYTSCGWFFDELSGIETVQVIQYAARVLQLVNEIFGQDLEPGFLERLERAKSNIPENQNGRVVYEKFAKPAMIDNRKAIAHYAISSVFHDYPDRLRIFSFTFQDEHREQFTAGKTRLAIGRTKVISEITLESETLAYAIHYMGEHNVIGGVGSFDSQEKYDLMFREIKTAYESADFPEIIRLIDRHFGKSAYSLKSLFKDEQRRIIGDVVSSTREDIENRFRLITERYAPLMKFLQSAGAPAPQELQSVSDLILHSDLRRQLKADQPDIERLRALIEEAKPRGPQVLDVEISFVSKHFLERTIQKIAEHPGEAEPMRMLEQVAALVMPLPIGLDVGRTQNTYWSLTQTALPDLRRRAEGDAKAKEALDAFLALGERLGFAPCALEPEPVEAKKD